MDSHGDMALATPMKASGSIDSSTDVHAGRKRKVRMTGAERDQLLENLDIEVKDRVHKLRNSSHFVVQSLKMRLGLLVGRHGKHILNQTLQDFCEHYQGNLSVFLTEDMSRVAARNQNVPPATPETSHIISVPVSSTAGKSVLFELDPSKSPSSMGLADLDSPAKQQVQGHIERLQAQLQALVNQMKK